MIGEQRFKESLKRFVGRRVEGMPEPGDPWGVWVEYRLQRLEGQQAWLMRLMLGALVAQFALQVLEMI